MSDKQENPATIQYIATGDNNVFSFLLKPLTTVMSMSTSMTALSVRGSVFRPMPTVRPATLCLRLRRQPERNHA